MPKRKKSYKKRTGSTVKGYKKAKAASTRKKQVRVVKRARDLKTKMRPFLGMPAKQVVKMNAASIQSYWYSFNGQGIAQETLGGEHRFPVELGIQVGMNDIYNPFKKNIAGSNKYHVRGFDEMSQHYASYRVIGSKATVKVRRAGPFNNNNPQASGVGEGDDPLERAPHETAIMGSPDQSDPMLVTCIDRTPRQDLVSFTGGSNEWGPNGYNPQTYRTLFENKDVKGVKYRELKSGVGATVTHVCKWSHKSLDSSTPESLRGGKFHDEKSAFGSLWDNGATAPGVLDNMLFNIIPVDVQPTGRDHKYLQRYIVSVDIDYMVLVYDKKIQNTN